VQHGTCSKYAVSHNFGSRPHRKWSDTRAAHKIHEIIKNDLKKVDCGLQYEEHKGETVRSGAWVRRADIPCRCAVSLENSGSSLL